jgi:hypothetical protein
MSDNLNLVHQEAEETQQQVSPEVPVELQGAVNQR